MLEQQVCHNYFSNALSKFNKARVKTLLTCADSLISSDRLTLTDIGRNLSGKALVKHKIKRVDRFLKNEHLFNEKNDIYAALIQPIISNLPTLPIAIDWSGCCGHEYHLLRASLLADGRSITIFNMVVEQKDLETRKSHDLFLDGLKQVIGEHPSVYIITDGGFLTPWYSKVLSLGWHVIGRLRGTMQCKIENSSQWSKLKQLHTGADHIPTALGKAQLTKHSPSACDAYLHLYHGKPKGRTGSSRFTKDTKMYQNLAKEPWLLACSDGNITSAQVVKLYSKRMQIEQNFRDDKSMKYGFGWRFSKSSGVIRLSILCLIASLAATTLWFIGNEAERRNWHVKFQANTVKNRRVLSFLTLAKQIIRVLKRRITMKYIENSLTNFKIKQRKDWLM